MQCRLLEVFVALCLAFVMATLICLKGQNSVNIQNAVKLVCRTHVSNSNVDSEKEMLEVNINLEYFTKDFGFH